MTTSPKRTPLNELAHQAKINSARWFPHLHDGCITAPDEHLKHLGLGLTEEAGEVAGVIKKMTGYRKEHRHGVEWDIAHELIDVLNYTLNIAAALHVDLDKALRAKNSICDTRWGAEEALPERGVDGPPGGCTGSYVFDDNDVACNDSMGYPLIVHGGTLQRERCTVHQPSVTS